MHRVFLIALLLGAALNAAAAGKIIILNSDKPGQGFNDTKLVDPVGGNTGTTLGEQRLNVFNEAARRLQNSIDTKVDIHVTATFSPIFGQCTETSGVLGQATPTYYLHSFESAPRQNVWYPAALANKFAGRDLDTRTDIFTQFNAEVDNQTCLGATDWYYGLDGKHGADVDLFVVVLHELAHGLGLSNAAGGAEFRDNRPSVFNTYTMDTIAGLTWDQMSPEQRRVSITNTGNVVWSGEQVRSTASRYLVPATLFAMSEPASLARDFQIGFASFGPHATKTALSGTIAAATDAADETGPTTTDGCTAFTNASAIAGKIALVDRGTCTFVTKALNAQAAGAIGLLVADNRRETCLPPVMGGSSSEVRIPAISVTQDDGTAIRAQLTANASVSGSLRTEPTHLAGGTKEGYVRLYAPCTQEPGSSIVHWDTVANPNLLMEPSVSGDLLHGLDLTLYQLLDIGWTVPPRTGRTILKR